MFKTLLLISLAATMAIADEYSFDMENIEPKSYEYGGYLRADNKTQRLRDQENLIAETNATLTELRAERERISVPGMFDTKEENALDKKIIRQKYP